MLRVNPQRRPYDANVPDGPRRLNMMRVNRDFD
jgi:hypothetical protein